MSNFGRHNSLRPVVDNGNGTATIILTRGYTATIDSDDIDLVAGWNWTAFVRPRTVYALRRATVANQSYTIYLHRWLLDAPHTHEVDHIDSDGLNCRRSNMRLATRKENAVHVRGWERAVSKYVGVSRHEQSGKWRAYVDHKHIGLYDTEEDAARARDFVVRQLRGPWAQLNFAV